MKRFSNRKTWKRGVLAGALMVSALLLFSACGEGEITTTSSTTTTTTNPTTTTTAPTGSALTIAKKVSVVDAKETSSSSALQFLSALRALESLGALAVADLPTGSQYFTDPTNVYVEERSAAAFDIVNEILCFLGQAKYGDLVNTGDYKAQIDNSKCSSSQDSASGGGQQSQNQTSGGNTPDYSFVTVNSTRQDNSSAQIVKFWSHEDEEGQKSVILINLVITEGASTSNPLGLFTLNFIGHPENTDGTPNTSIVGFKGYLGTVLDSSGQVQVQFVINGSQQENVGSGTETITFVESATLTKSADGASGSGSVSESLTFSTSTQFDETTAFNVAFNETHFLREDTGTSTQQCLDRNAFNETVWGYGLYDNTGTRVTRNSGFPIRYEDTGGTSYQGWVGFWGLWMPDNVTIPDGATVYKQEFGSGGTPTETAHTVVIKGGKLIKFTRNLLTLGDIKGIPMDYWENSSGNQFRVVWSGTALNKEAQFNQTTFLWQDITPTPIALTGLDWDTLNFWSQGLGGNVSVKLDSCTGNPPSLSCSASDATQVVFFASETVSPTTAGVPTSLRCYSNCPDPSTLTTSNPWLDSNNWDPSNLNDYDYTFSTTTMLLQYSSTDVVLTTANSAFQWGLQSGLMFDPTSANLALLACDWNTALICPWKGWEALTVFYTWETGNNTWNKFTALQDSSSNYVAFEAPLSVEYTHTDIPNGYDATKFYLEYSGFGDLHGIPGKCVNFDTGVTESCGSTSRWIPEFSIADGTEVFNGADSSISYLVKATDKEQQMAAVASSFCTGLTVTSFTLPSINDWVDPAIGTEPVVSGPPKVIGGVIQTL